VTGRLAARHRPADTGRLHAEVADLERVDYCVAVRKNVGPAKLAELREKLADAKAHLKTGTSTLAAERVLALCGALARMGLRGYRGIIAPCEVLAETVAEASGGPCSVRTLRNAVAMLEQAGLIERGTYGAGKPVQVRRNGKVGWAKRKVLTITFVQGTMQLWSPPVSSPKPRFSTPANFAATRSVEGSPFGGNPNAHAVDIVGASPEQTGSGKDCDSPHPSAPSPSSSPPPTASPLAADAAQTPPLATPRQARRDRPPDGERSEEGGSAKTRPARNVPYRPRKDEPATRARGAWALVYDLESELLRRGACAAEVRDHVSRAFAELDPQFRGNESQPWDSWVWDWRAMDQAARRDALRRAIIPSLRATIKRGKLWEMPAAPGFCRGTSPANTNTGTLAAVFERLLAHNTPIEPGPRARPDTKPPPPAPPTTAELDPFFAAVLERWKSGAIPCK